ncbi:MAG: O-antigen ligase family protein [Bacillota bacterium]
MNMKTLARWAVYVPFFVIPFLPLYVANGLYFPFITGKGFAFRILVEIAFAGWMVLALADKRYRPRFSWIFVLYGAFVLWMLIADIFGVNPHKALWSNFERMEGWVTLIHVFMFFTVAGAVLTTDKLWRKWWLTFLGASALVSIYCLFQLGGFITIHQGGVRVDGTFGNAAYLAAYMLFAVAVSVWQGLDSKGWLRYSLFALAAVEAFLIFASATRGAILGFIGAAIVASALFAFESGGRARKIAGGALIGIVLISGAFYLVRNASFIQSDPTLARISSIGPSDLKVRATLWHMALEGVAERPVLGWGQEGFNHIFNKYYEPSLYAQEPWFDRAHNAFIDWLVAGGIPALLLFFAAFAMAIYALYRGGATRQERILLVAALVAYGIQAIVVFDNLFTYVPLAAILATAHGVASRPWKRLDEANEADTATLQMAAPIIAVIAVIAIWIVNVPNIATASELVHALSVQSRDVTPNVALFQKALDEHSFAHQEISEQLLQFAESVGGAGGSDAIAKLYTFAMGEMDKEIARQPDDSRLYLQEAIAYRVNGQYDKALKQIQLAHQYSPKKQSILTEEGLDYWQLKQYDQASQAFTQAYELDPSFPQLAAYAAAGKIIAGDLAGGKQFLMDKMGTTTVNNEALILAYYQAHDFDDLVLVLEEQARQYPDDISTRFRLAAGYLAAGRYQQVRTLLNSLVAQHPEAASQAAAFLQQIPAK